MKHLLPAPAFYLQLKIIADLCGTSGYNRKPDNFVAPSPDCDSKLMELCSPDPRLARRTNTSYL